MLWIMTTSRPVALQDAEAPSGAAKTLKFPFPQYLTDVTTSAVSGHNPRNEATSRGLWLVELAL